jgi:hypothetical protein
MARQVVVAGSPCRLALYGRGVNLFCLPSKDHVLALGASGVWQAAT